MIKVLKSVWLGRTRHECLLNLKSDQERKGYPATYGDEVGEWDVLD